MQSFQKKKKKKKFGTMLIFGDKLFFQLSIGLLLFGDWINLYEQAKQNQKGVDRKVLPSVEGQEEGKWIVIDSGLCCSFFLVLHFTNVSQFQSVLDLHFGIINVVP